MDNNIDIQQRFKEIVKTLPEDKKKALYKRLKGLDAEERNKVIESIVLKDEEVHKGGQPQKKPQGGQHNRPQNRKNNNSGKKPQNGSQKNQQKGSQKGQPKQQQKQQPKQPQQPKQQQKSQAKNQPSKPQPKQQPKQAKQPVKNEQVKKESVKKEPVKSTTASKILLTIAVIMTVGLLGFMAYVKRANIMELWNAVTGNTTQTTDTVETSAVESTEPSATPTPTVTSTPTPTPVPLAEDAPDLTGMTVVIDPGHQMTTSTEVETVASWMSAEKPRCTCGGEGISTGIREYDLTLRFSTMLCEYLEECGANVIMTRTENDVDLSNQERAQMATSANCNLFLRIHADSANDSLTSGIQMYVPSSGNNHSTDKTRADKLGALLSETTGLTYNGCLETEVYTGLNYATSVHSVQVSLGYLSNSDDEAIITDEEMQYNMVVCFAQFCAEYK